MTQRGSSSTASGGNPPAGSSSAVLALAWLVVGVPLAYGIFQTLLKAAKLFTG